MSAGAESENLGADPAAAALAPAPAILQLLFHAPPGQVQDSQQEVSVPCAKVQDEVQTHLTSLFAQGALGTDLKVCSR